VRDIIVTDADADANELRALLDAQGLTTVDVTGPDGGGQITVGVPDDVDGTRVDLLLQRYVGARADDRLVGLTAFAQTFAALDLDSATTFDELKDALLPIVTAAGVAPPYD
jgi:hypothetical protein